MDERYQRHMLMPQIDAAGQEKLSASSVLVVGAGGLGSPLLYYLAAVGLGHIHIIDSDTVSLSNLNRQFIHFEKDINSDKSRSAKEKLELFNSSIQISAAVSRLSKENIEEITTGYDIAVSCVDNTETRELLNKACVCFGIPLVDGGVKGFRGYVMTVVPHITPCYHCIFSEADFKPEISEILGATAGVAGSIMAAQTVKSLLGIDTDVTLLYFDLLSLSFTPVKAKRNPDCSICGPHSNV